jgi:hypothetical protein
MSLSEKLGALPFLGWVWDLSPFWAAAMVLIADFGIIFGLMALEGLSSTGVWPWKRTHYRTFLVNDTIVFPVFMYLAVAILNDPPRAVGGPAWFHWALLIGGFAVSILMEFKAVKDGQYTMSQEFSPSKLWHTLIFGVMFYWLMLSFSALIIATGEKFDLRIVLIPLLAWLLRWAMKYDSTHPFPKNAHLEGSYALWNWHEREDE